MCTVTFTLVILPWVKVMIHPWVMDNNCKILSRPNIVVNSYDPDTNFGYVSTVTFTLMILPCVKVTIHHCVMNNNCLKYYQDPT